METSNQNTSKIQENFIKYMQSIQQEYSNHQQNRTGSHLQEATPLTTRSGQVSALKRQSTVRDLPELQDYARYLISEGELEEGVLIGSIIIFSRYLALLSKSTPLNLHKLLAAALFVAQKYLLETEVWRLCDFSEIAGLSQDTLRCLDVELLHEIEYKVYVGRKEYKLVKKNLMK